MECERESEKEREREREREKRRTSSERLLHHLEKAQVEVRAWRAYIEACTCVYTWIWRNFSLVFFDRCFVRLLARTVDFNNLYRTKVRETLYLQNARGTTLFCQIRNEVFMLIWFLYSHLLWKIKIRLLLKNLNNIRVTKVKYS